MRLVAKNLKTDLVFNPARDSKRFGSFGRANRFDAHSQESAKQEYASTP